MSETAFVVAPHFRLGDAFFKPIMPPEAARGYSIVPDPDMLS
jgi:hypothetical protein